MAEIEDTTPAPNTFSAADEASALRAAADAMIVASVPSMGFTSADTVIVCEAEVCSITLQKDDRRTMAARLTAAGQPTLASALLGVVGVPLLVAIGNPPAYELRSLQRSDVQPGC